MVEVAAINLKIQVTCMDIYTHIHPLTLEIVARRLLLANIERYYFWGFLMQYDFIS